MILKEKGTQTSAYVPFVTNLTTIHYPYNVLVS